MSWRFRKVFSAGPLRMNLSRGGVGWSCGIPGLRYGISPNGRRYVSVGLPGFGLYWMKYQDEGMGRGADEASPPDQQRLSRQSWRRVR